MCNLYTIKATKAEYLDYCQAIDGWRKEVEKTYVSPNRPGYVVRVADGVRQLDVMTWGFPFQGKAVTNVRNYTSPFWRSALARPERRCLVPVTELQEWSAEPDPTTGKKRPVIFTLPNRPVFCFAGIWRPLDDGAVFFSLTTGYDGDPAVHIVGAVHPKAIPVILHQEDHERWLSADVGDALQLATGFPGRLLIEQQQAALGGRRNGRFGERQGLNCRSFTWCVAPLLSSATASSTFVFSRVRMSQMSVAQCPYCDTVLRHADWLCPCVYR